MDVTVRHPFADRYQPAAGQTAGKAACQAEKEKHDKYLVRVNDVVMTSFCPSLVAAKTVDKRNYKQEELLNWRRSDACQILDNILLLFFKPMRIG